MKTKSLTRWVNQAGRERLVAAVSRAEKVTAAEIVVMVSGRASTVEHVPALIFTITALLVCISALAHLHLPLGLTIKELLAAGIALALIVAWLGGRHPLLQRLFTTPSERERQVAERAELEFYRRGLTETRGRTGVLVFVALMEHRIHILADQAIASRVNDDTWKDGVAAILTGIRGNDLVGGLERALALIAPILGTIAPASADNPNELSDHVILIPS